MTAEIFGLIYIGLCVACIPLIILYPIPDPYVRETERQMKISKELEN